jgi:endonuclease YncB( thermonuclease family)
MALWRSKRRKGGVFGTSLIVLVALLIVGYRLVDKVGLDKRPDARFSVARVLDGDTAELTGGDRLRLLGIDTPEAGEPLHDEARALLTRLSLNQPCRVDYGNTRRDKYGRMLGYLYVDTVFVNRAIISAGLAYVYLFSDNDLKRPEVKELLEAQRSAIAAHRGLWGLPHQPEPYYINTNGSFRLHRPNCVALGPQKEGRFHTYSSREAGLSEGLSPCRTCKP